MKGLPFSLQIETFMKYFYPIQLVFDLSAIKRMSLILIACLKLEVFFNSLLLVLVFYKNPSVFGVYNEFMFEAIVTNKINI